MGERCGQLHDRISRLEQQWAGPFSTSQGKWAKWGRPAWLASKAHLPGDWTFPHACGMRKGLPGPTRPNSRQFQTFLLRNFSSGHCRDIFHILSKPLHLEATVKSYISPSASSSATLFLVLYPALVPNRPPSHQAPPTSLLPKTPFNVPRIYNLTTTRLFTDPAEFPALPTPKNEHNACLLISFKSSHHRSLSAGASTCNSLCFGMPLSTLNSSSDVTSKA